MRIGLLIAAMLVAPPALAQVPAPIPAPAPVPVSDAVRLRAEGLVVLLGGGGDVSAMFAPAFLAQVDEQQIRTIAKQLSDGLGKPLAVASITALGPTSARLQIRYEHGQVDLALAVEPAAPNRLIGLRVTGAGSDIATVEEIMKQIAALPGIAGFDFARLGDDAPVALHTVRPDGDLAIGSAFKLAILSELIRATNAGERHWDDPVTLDGRPLPGGFYTQRPAGTQVPLRELAQRMISVSDNSATDILLATLGRARVEAVLPVIGWRDAARNRPLLSTLDMFRLKGLDHGAPGRRWPTLDETGRRALLARTDATALSAIDPLLFRDGRPVMVDTVEWFASPADLVRTMDWIRRNTAAGPGAEARAILAANPGIAQATAARWAYLGYKGGSEPGVIAMTFLLQSKRGDWYALAVGWNDKDAPVEEGKLIALASRAVELLADR